MAKLSEIFDLQMGKTPARKNSDYWSNGTNDWVSIADLSGYEKYVERTKEQITDKAVQESGIKAVPPNTVIMSFKLSLGKTAITQEAVYTNEAIMAFIPKNACKILPDYLFYLLSSRDWSKGTNRAVMGATLNKATLGEVDMEIPSLNKQRQAAAVLDKVSSLISLRKQQLGKLDELVKARFVEMFGNVANSSKHPGIPLGEICSTLSGGTPTTKVPEYYQGNIPWISTPYLGENHINGRNAKAYITQGAVENSATHLLPKDTIVFGIRVGVGKSSIIDEAMCTNQDIVALMNIDKNKYNLLFLKHVLDSYQSYFDSIKKGATILGITTDDLKKVIVPNVKLELQEQFATFVEQTDKSKLTVQKSLDKLEILKRSLMQEYFG